MFFTCTRDDHCIMYSFFAKRTQSALHLKGKLKMRESTLANYETYFTSQSKLVVMETGTLARAAVAAS